MKLTPEDIDWLATEVVEQFEYYIGIDRRDRYQVMRDILTELLGDKGNASRCPNCDHCPPEDHY